MKTEWLADGHEWLRIVDPAWANPLDLSFAAVAGGRWNPPNSFPVLYLNEDVVTARLNLRGFVAAWPYEPEDLRGDTGPMLVGAGLPHRQRVVDVHTPGGVAAVELPSSYPYDTDGSLVSHRVCQPIGTAIEVTGKRGVRCRSARSPDGAGRELAWYPASSRSVAHLTSRLPFTNWYWG
ncbi:MAG: RES family NAD+ phosphorylase [Actinomycetota bacterium]|nr:RES family NAD+ phosphorylase [Actinomycetota bacterium]